MNGIYITTACSNLRELNAQLRAEGNNYQYRYCGYMVSANGYPQRTYIAEDEHGRTYGEYINIYFKEV